MFETPAPPTTPMATEDLPLEVQPLRKLFAALEDAHLALIAAQRKYSETLVGPNNDYLAFEKGICITISYLVGLIVLFAKHQVADPLAGLHKTVDQLITTMNIVASADHDDIDLVANMSFDYLFSASSDLRNRESYAERLGEVHKQLMQFVLSATKSDIQEKILTLLTYNEQKIWQLIQLKLALVEFTNMLVVFEKAELSETSTPFARLPSPQLITPPGFKGDIKLKPFSYFSNESSVLCVVFEQMTKGTVAQLSTNYHATFIYRDEAGIFYFFNSNRPDMAPHFCAFRKVDDLVHALNKAHPYSEEHQHLACFAGIATFAYHAASFHSETDWPNNLATRLALQHLLARLEKSPDDKINASYLMTAILADDLNSMKKFSHGSKVQNIYELIEFAVELKRVSCLQEIFSWANRFSDIKHKLYVQLRTMITYYDFNNFKFLFDAAFISVTTDKLLKNFRLDDLFTIALKHENKAVLNLFLKYETRTQTNIFSRENKRRAAVILANSEEVTAAKEGEVKRSEYHSSETDPRVALFKGELQPRAPVMRLHFDYRILDAVADNNVHEQQFASWLPRLCADAILLNKSDASNQTPLAHIIRNIIHSYTMNDTRRAGIFLSWADALLDSPTIRISAFRPCNIHSDLRVPVIRNVLLTANLPFEITIHLLKKFRNCNPQKTFAAVWQNIAFAKGEKRSVAIDYLSAVFFPAESAATLNNLLFIEANLFTQIDLLVFFLHKRQLNYATTLLQFISTATLMVNVDGESFLGYAFRKANKNFFAALIQFHPEINLAPLKDLYEGATLTKEQKNILECIHETDKAFEISSESSYAMMTQLLRENHFEEQPGRVARKVFLSADEYQLTIIDEQTTTVYEARIEQLRNPSEPGPQLQMKITP